MPAFGRYRLIEAVQACRPNWRWRRCYEAAARIASAGLPAFTPDAPCAWLELVEAELNRAYPAGCEASVPEADVASQRAWQARWRRARCRTHVE